MVETRGLRRLRLLAVRPRRFSQICKALHCGSSVFMIDAAEVLPSSSPLASSHHRLCSIGITPPEVLKLGDVLS